MSVRHWRIADIYVFRTPSDRDLTFHFVEEWLRATTHDGQAIWVKLLGDMRCQEDPGLFIEQNGEDWILCRRSGFPLPGLEEGTVLRAVRHLPNYEHPPCG